jgi:cell wall-associated NlpC family hydrolase
MSEVRRLVLGAALAMAVPSVVQAQAGVGVEVGRYFEGDDWTVFRAGLEHPLWGPLSVALYGTHLRASSSLGERLWGAGADLAFFREARQGPYAVGGLAGGFATQASNDFWGSWSVGAGYQLVPVSFLSIAAEARWRKLSPGGRDGAEVSLRLGALFGRRSVASPQPRAPGPRPGVTGTAAAPGPVGLSTIGRLDAGATLVDSVVATAAEAMGTAYRLGGTTTEGFDCSGLIQYAYAQHGIELPRTSGAQAEAGEKVERNLEALRPGDILTFSTSGGPVTHVGLYVGDGRFIHSASRGVQLSQLSPDDPYGRWWHRRWVGARRIVRGER